MSNRLARANAIRFLSIDAVQKANSGHPGMPMGMADIAEVLWHDFLQHNPANPAWPNRDRFILSNGHGSMLQYALLHLTGYALSLEELKNFRQLHSKTPGHPEFGLTPGVETTTGPLGQGLGNAVGMAIAERHLAATFNQPEFPLIDHYTYCFVGDGCLMEGISHEVASLAGTLGLGRLIVLYDDNQISIDGDVNGWFTDNTPMRFRAYGWHVIENVDGHASDAIHAAVLAAQAEKDKPTLICCKTKIGWGSPNFAGTAATHGAALGEKEVALVRENLHWPHSAFVIPDNLYAEWDARAQGAEREAAWQALFTRYATIYPALAAEFTRRMQGALPQDFAKSMAALVQQVDRDKQSIATRKASQIAIKHFADCLPELMGGSADLTESNCTDWKGATLFSQKNPHGQYIHYGVREFGMSAIMNGLALGNGIIPFGGTFLTFSDYARNALRLAALMQQKVIFVYTHDSIGLGEDGPTHQPVEHLPSLRLIPDLSTWRPCDTVETAVAWGVALSHPGPTCLLFSRQNLAFQERDAKTIANIQRGGYVLYETNPQAKMNALLIATGSEVQLAMEAALALEKEGIHIRVVSMPSTDVFLKQDAAYQASVLPEYVTAKIAIEAAASVYWYRFVGTKGAVMGLDHFGASAPAKEVFADKGFTVSHVVAVVKEKVLQLAHCPE